VSGDLFSDGDPFDLPLWQQAEMMADAPPRPAKDYVTCRLAWLAKVRPLVRSVEQLIVLELIYRRCLLERGQTVALPNTDLEVVGMDRRGKYRALTALVKAGLITKGPRNGKTTRLTLHDFP
jgi:hypothetical protein